MSKLVDCVEQNTFNLSETIDSVLMYTDTNTAVQLNDIKWRSTLTYTHPGLCHTMLINKLDSNAPIVVRLRTSPGHRHSLMLHDPRFNAYFNETPSALLSRVAIKIEPNTVEIPADENNYYYDHNTNSNYYY